jgi:hypothetical protein
VPTLSRDRDREQLERELQTDEYQELLQHIQQAAPFLRQFKTWARVLAFMRPGKTRNRQRDQVLRPILRRYRKHRDPRLASVLLAVFWPGLQSIQYRKRGWDEDAQERWQNVASAFFTAISRVDVRKRPERLAQKIHNDTIHHLHGHYARLWSREEHELLVDPAMFDTVAGPPRTPDLKAFDEQKARARKLKRLRRHLKAGWIKEADFLLLVSTRIYGQSVAEYARQVGLSYEAAKKRRQRAEAAIRQATPLIQQRRTGTHGHQV